MATKDFRKLEVAFTISGNSPMLLAFPEAASLTAKAGEVVYLASGYLTEAANSSGVVTTNPVLGVLGDDGHNGASAGLYSAGVYIANFDTIFKGTLVNSSGTRIATNVGYVGCVAGLYADTTNSRVYVAGTVLPSNRLGPPKATNEYPLVQIVALDPEDDVGDVGGRVLFKFLSHAQQLMTTS
jgi:hypothetical protein